MADWQIFGGILLILVLASFAYTRYIEHKTVQGFGVIRECLEELLGDFRSTVSDIEDAQEMFKSIESEADLDKALKELEEKGIHAECIYKGKIKKGKK